MSAEIPLATWKAAEDLMRTDSKIKGPIWWQSRAKENFDYLATCLFGPAILGITVFGAGLVLAEDGPPAIVYLERCGPEGKFLLPKLRTMIKGARAMQADVCDGRTLREVKLSGNDPRLLPISQILRVSSIDELPQFGCVLKKKMSLVGPRGVSGEELELERKLGCDTKIVEQWLRNLKQGWKLGLTGLTQIFLRQLNAPHWKLMEMDLLMAREETFGSDLKMLLKTARPSVLFGGK